MNKFLDPDPLEFEKLEKERVINELEKTIKKLKLKEEEKKLKN
ncbi:hypothetical protein [Fusobacterium polymorphum]